MTRARFQLAGPTGGDVLGVWGAAPRASAIAAARAGEEVWRVELPRDGRAALADRWHALRAAEAGVEESDRRLTAFVRRATAGGAPPTFAPGAPEEELAAAFRTDPATAVGFLSGWLPGWQESVREVREFLGRATDALSGSVRVETAIEGTFVGRSRIGLFGSTEAVWRAGANRERGASHLQSVALALATRRAWLRLAGVLVVGAAGLAAALSSGAWLSALPAAWRFVRRVLAEVRQLSASGAV